LSASSILNFFSFISTSEAAPTFIIATPQANFASLSANLSFVYCESLASISFFNSPTLAAISFFSQPPEIIVVLSFEEITVFADHKSSIVTFSSFIPRSEVII